MAPRSTQPLTEMITGNISLVVKAAGAYGSQTYHLHVPIVLKSKSLKIQKPPGLVQACAEIALHFTRQRRLKVRNIYVIVLRRSKRREILDCEA